MAGEGAEGVRRRRSRKDEEYDDDNGDQAPCRACEKQPYRSGIAHGSRRGFRIIVVEHACTERSGTPLHLSHSLIIPFRFLGPCVGPRQCRQEVQVGSRQDYPVNNAPNSSRDLSCIIAKLFRSRFPIGVPFRLLWFSLFPSLSTRKRLLRALLEVRGITLPPRRQSDDVLLKVLLFLLMYLGQSDREEERERERSVILLRSMINSYVH